MSKYLVVVLSFALALGSLAVGCSQGTAAPTQPPAAPTAAAAAPTKAAEPSKGASPATPTRAAEPTKAAEAPAKKVDFPAAGKSISIIVPFAAGGSTDSATRILAPLLEKELGVPVQVVNKPGATTQVALTELVNSKPDGYTLLMFAIPSSLITYLDPERKAPYTRKDFQPVATAFVDGLGVVVKADSRFQSARDVVDAARANPGGIKVSTAGLMGVNHLGALAWQEAAGVKFAFVHFNSGAEALTAALGGHVDVATATLGNVRSHFKSGTVRVLGIADSQESDLLPGAKTLESQGYKVYASAGYIVTAPAGTPGEITSIIDAAVKKVVALDEYRKRINDIGMEPRYMDAQKAAEYWTDREAWTRNLMPLAR